MAKFLNTSDKVVVNNQDLSLHAFRLDSPQTKEQVDVSGFSNTLTREFLAGLEDATITIGFLQDFGANSVHATLYPLYQGGSAFPIYIQPDGRLGTAATNPLFGGSALMFDYNGLSGELNARGEIEASFKPAPDSLFTWGTVAP